MNALDALIATDPRPTILLQPNGTIVAFNSSARGKISDIERGADLGTIAEMVPERLYRYLHLCACSSSPVIGTLPLRSRDSGEVIKWRSDGGVVVPASPDAPAQIVLRLRPPADAHVSFLSLKRQVEALNREIHDRKLLQIDLEAALEAKQILLSEVHHRVKNNMQVVASMLALAKRESDPKKALQQAICRVRAVASVQELLHNSQRYAEVDCHALLASVLGSLKEVHLRDEISVHIDCSNHLLCGDRATSIALIVNELVENAYKHAFPAGRSGTIRIAVRVDGGQTTLEISDDGAPYAEPQAGGSGLRIVESLASRLGGKFDLFPQTKSARITFS